MQEKTRVYQSIDSIYKERIMATKYRVLKQLIPVPLNADDPTWAKRQVWVQKLNSEDTIDEFDTLAEAEAKKDELTAADETGRVYKVEEITE